MNYLRQRSKAKLVLSAVLCVSVVGALIELSRASVGTISKADLSGPWQMTLLGNTGCGLTSMLVTFTLNGSGVATNATITSHYAVGGTTTCIDGNVLADQNFTIDTLTANGSGTAGLSCGAGCGWGFNIQVAPDRAEFNVVDVSTANPHNLLVGSAIHQ
jgi:hypothetical protein